MTKEEIGETLQGSLLTPIYAGVKVRLCATFNSHPEPGHQNASIYGEGFTWEDALEALAYHVKECMSDVVEWAKVNGEDDINPIRISIDPMYYYYIKTDRDEKIYLASGNPELYESYCYPRQIKTLYSPSGRSINSLFNENTYKAARDKVIPSDYESQARAYLNDRLKQDFDEGLLRKEENDLDYLRVQIQRVLEYKGLTKDDVLKVLEKL